MAENNAPPLVHSIIRTVTPTVVGAATAQLVSLGLNPDPEFGVILEGSLTVGFTGVYYWAVRVLETYVWPKLGWLLLSPKQPLVQAEPAVAPRARGRRAAR